MHRFLNTRMMAIVLAAVVLAACSSAPRPGSVPPGTSFAANILDDGTKLFTFTLHAQRPAPAVVRGADGLPNQQQQAEMARRMRGHMAEDARKGLHLMLQENGYCQEGYVLHELYEDRAGYVIRGECRDAASDADRARYPGRVNG